MVNNKIFIGIDISAAGFEYPILGITCIPCIFYPIFYFVETFGFTNLKQVVAFAFNFDGTPFVVKGFKVGDKASIIFFCISTCYDAWNDKSGFRCADCGRKQGHFYFIINNFCEIGMIGVFGGLGNKCQLTANGEPEEKEIFFYGKYDGYIGDKDTDI